MRDINYSFKLMGKTKGNKNTNSVPKSDQDAKQKKTRSDKASASQHNEGLQVKPEASIGKYEHAPSFMKDNEHITHGYRINFDSPKKILKSLFMVHNESVNIWSHFVPAIIICIVIIGFVFFVDKQNIVQDFERHYDSLSDSFEHYSHSLDNLTLIENMKEMKSKTQNQFEEIQRNVITSFSSFSQGFNQNMHNLNSILDINVTGLKDSVRDSIKKNMHKLQIMKIDYEKVIAPALVSKLSSLDNSYISELRSRMQTLRQDLDSDSYKYMDLLHKESPNPHKVSRWPIIVFMSSAFICLMCSSLFHLFYPMSTVSHTIFTRFDYAGISMLIAGSTFPPFYYGMYCYLEVFIVYEIIISVLAVTIFILSMFEWMHKAENSLYKALIYGGFGLFNVIPFSHLFINSIFFNSGDGFNFATTIPYVGLLGLSYLFGLYVYTARCPERYYPGKFNLCGHSHQIWHLCVVFGIIFTYFGALESYDMRKAHICPL